MSSALLTFGVEIEHVLVFHSSLLRPHLPPSTLIIRDLSLNTRLALRDTSQQYNATRPYYNGWAFTSPSTYPYDKENRQRCLQTHGCRGYADEALKLEQQIFSDKAASVDVDVDAGEEYETESDVDASEEDETEFVVEPMSFERWHLTRDNSLTGLDASELKSVLERHGIIRNEDEEDENLWDWDWDSSGLELVSRVLPLSDLGFRELEDALAVLNNNAAAAAADGEQSKKYIAATNRFCGLHVHVGLPHPDASYPSLAHGDPAAVVPPTFALKTLQHLALLLAVFEPHITALHAPHRAPGGVDLRSNRESFLQEPEEHVDEDDSGYASGDSGADAEASFDLEKLHGMSLSPSKEEEEAIKEEQQLRKRARDAIFADGMTVEALTDLMSPTRERVVNFTYLERTDGQARTVEFRQMEGCLDARAIRNWVGFCGGVVRLAERLGESGKDWVDDEGKVWGKETVGWRDLSWEMGMSEEDVEWWEGRWKRMEEEREQRGDLSQ
ncbi:MAG: hypothetical protein LQ342_004748 [Letrouitia transgressa]|nr:MAG: hypothetical protein LQ342_004748 [Letrouitia transgressa]